MESIHIEQERDASAILTDLDKGLRSINPGEQCEVVVRFPRLFEKYPFPILINSAFLKLSDIYRNGSNFLRLCILQVVEHSEKHLDKIINLEEFIRRIYTAMHSNDPVARALTLRILGLCAQIATDNKQIHHCIKVGLLSHDVVEVQAAIFAVNRFAAVSESFATSVSDKLCEMLTTNSSSIDMKLCIIPALRHMHRDSEVMERVEGVCMDLLSSHPSTQMTSVILLTLTTLSSKAVVNTGSCCTLLLNYLKTEQRLKVQLIVLKCLFRLAQTASHVWSSDNVSSLCRFVTEQNIVVLQLWGLKILTTLLSRRSFSTSESSWNLVIACCNRFSYSSHIELAQWAVKLFVCLVADKRISDVETINQASSAIENVLRISVEMKKPAVLSVVIASVIRFGIVHQNMISRYVTNFVDFLSFENDVSINSKLSEGLLAMCGRGLTDGKQCVDIVCSKLQASANDRPNLKNLTRQLVTMILQIYCGEEMPNTTQSSVLGAIEDAPAWLAYQLGRQAARYGHHALAASIFNTLKSKVATETFYFWLCGLQHCCEAEGSFSKGRQCNSSEINRQLSNAYHTHLKTACALEATMNPVYPLYFQVKFIQCRLKMLTVLRRLLNICNDFYLSPPPALLSHSASTYYLPQLKDCLSELHMLDATQATLYESCFDADEQSLRFLQLREKICQFLIGTVGSLIALCKGRKANFTEMSETATDTRELSLWQKALANIHSLTKSVNSDNSVDSLKVSHITYVRQIIGILCSVPLCLPRFFFQRLFNTDIKLAILPQPTGNSEAVLVNKDVYLALKVEGVIQYDSNHFRKIKQVKVIIKSELKQRAAPVTDVDEKVIEHQTSSIREKCVTPHNDYFFAEFLMRFAETGTYQLTVTAFIIDRNTGVWSVGQPMRLAVKSHEDRVVHQAIPSHLQGT